MNTNSNLEFRKIPSLNYLYEINSNGTIIRNVKSKKQLLIKLDMHHSKSGYYTTFVHNKSINDGKNTRVMIHQAVAECWLGKCPLNMEVDHIDRNSHNNDYRNLRYVTKSEQMINRDHSNISEQGKINLEEARKLRAKKIRLYNENEDIMFESRADASRFLAEKYDKGFDAMRDRFKKHRDHIFDYDVDYTF